ncbi:low specificity L-threonine aldolase [Anaerobacillus sp. CMMVII]|uniref:threonine aldolase family protein n=1 Tax=Anaerobacillus sp. CMMVII TaxID=2755588 RepID=UPI0021B72B96|nr:beta-eliminating lyase-related protein [Anaerobacillus sp. CMMVII]MCT8138043.1 low specificity L-threonine aldolase [Anaerobacillus sp. CMMVII]
MSVKNLLVEAYKQTSYQLVGHGHRTIQMLTDALKDYDDLEESDMYGTGKIIEQFQAKLKECLGKEAAVFFPSGTMAQQIAMRIWCDKTGLKKVAYHPLCHLEIHEEEGLKKLHQIDSVLLANETRIIQLEDIENMEEEVSCILLELPQREIGGELPDYQTLEAISSYCRDKEIKLHLDGARLFEILPYYQKSAKEVCALFDSVYVSFYKGIGGIAGAILAGDEDFIQESIVWKRRHGGDLISLYPYIISADYYFTKRLHKMNQYYEEAKELAKLYNECEAIQTRPLEPVSNMFHVHVAIPKDQLELILITIYKETGIGLTRNMKATSENSCSFEVSIGDQFALVPKTEIKNLFQRLNMKLKEVTP